PCDTLPPSAISSSITCPQRFRSADFIRINWEGPDYPSDYIATIQPGAGGSDEITYAYTKDGSPLELRLPAEPGDYEIVYVQHHGRKGLHVEAIATTPTTISLATP